MDNIENVHDPEEFRAFIDHRFHNPTRSLLVMGNYQTAAFIIFAKSIERLLPLQRVFGKLMEIRIYMYLLTFSIEF